MRQRVSTDGMRRYQLAKVAEIITNEKKRLTVLRYGAGKTWVALAASDRLRCLHDHDGMFAIVLCTLRTVQSWTIELEKRYKGVRVVSLTDPNYDNEPITKHTVLLVPHHLLSFPVRLAQVQNEIRWNKPFALLCDESTKIKNQSASRTRGALSIADTHRKTVPNGLRLAFTGNASPEGAHELWSQIAFSHGDDTPLGSYWQMVAKYFTRTDRGLVLRAEMVRSFYNTASAYVCRMTADEWREFKSEDHVHVSYRTAYFEETAEQLDMVDRLMQQWEIEHNGTLTTFDYATSVHLKAQQIANGFWLNPDGSACHLDDSPKVRLLVNELEEALDSKVDADTPPVKAIVWCHYKEDYVVVGRALLEASIEYVIGPEADSLIKFRDGSPRVILMPVTVSEGMNELVVASVAFYFSNVYSLEMRDQSEHRIIRIDQKTPLVTIVDLCGKRSEDRAVVESLQTKRPLQPRIKE